MSHQWTRLPVGKQAKTTLTWPYCQRCGLIKLKNRATDLACRQECVKDADDEREYRKFSRYFKD